MTGRGRRTGAVLLAAALVAAPAAVATAQPPNSDAVVVSDDGAVRVPPHAVPQSNLLSPAGRVYVARHLKDEQNPELTRQVDGVPPMVMPYLEQQRAMFPVDMQDTRIAGVHVYVFTPKGGVSAANAKRVLIELHGGGFSGCWPGCALMESIPISSVGGIKVVSVDYREGPQNRFPAASQDVAAVYSALLKNHAPKEIGIYGCSAGGALTGQAIAWFETHDLPIPGAIGLLCSGLGSVYAGDSLYTGMAFGEGRLFDGHPPGLPPGYWEGAQASDPLVIQTGHPDVLAKFPPTLFVTGSRDFQLSNAVHSNVELDMAGVETKLLIWDGLFHGFFYDPGIPESQEAYRAVVGFFDKELVH